MNKKLMAVAVAGALAAPVLVFAQKGDAQMPDLKAGAASTIQIYGNIRVDYNFLDQGANREKVDMFSRYDSSIGFRGEEKLGGGMAAWFQCENTMDITSEPGARGTGSTALCDRNSGFGLKGNFGNFFIGGWDTPYKLVHGSQVRPFSTTGAFGVGGLLFNEIAGNTTNQEDNVTSFSRRQANTINYHSPNFKGFHVMGAYSATDDSTNTVTPTVVGKPRLYSLGATYTGGPLYVGVGFERHQNFNPSVTPTGGNPTPLATNIGTGATQYSGGNDESWEIAAGYTFAGVFRLGGIYSDTKYKVTNSTNLQVKAWGVYGDWKLAGPHSLRAGYTQQDDVKGTSTANINNYAAPVAGGVARGATGARLMAIQYAHAMSKRTELNVGYVKLGNDDNSRQRLQGSATRNVGRDQSAWVMGVRHNF